MFYILTLIHIPGRPVSNLEFLDFSGSVLPRSSQYLCNLQPARSTSVHAPFNHRPWLLGIHAASGIVYPWRQTQGRGLSRSYQVQEVDLGHLGKDYLGPKYLEHDLDLRGGGGGRVGSESASPRTHRLLALWGEEQLENGHRAALEEGIWEGFWEEVTLET